ncbi:MAG: Rrf2 family transcriptional regulator [Bacteroidetes bacterium]|nr:Rrf2 family transcriptional regulator [Bacteroidota bacterium]
MLSLSCKASIKAVVYLGSKLKPDERAGIKSVARFINENEHTVGKILQKMVKANIIHSTKGPNGGFYISAKQKRIPVMAIVHAIDGQGVFNQCGLGFSKCSDSHPCPLHTDFKPVREQFKEMCSNSTIETLCSRVDQGIAILMRK